MVRLFIRKKKGGAVVVKKYQLRLCYDMISPNQLYSSNWLSWLFKLLGRQIESLPGPVMLKLFTGRNCCGQAPQWGNGG